MVASLIPEIIEELKTLPNNLQQEVLNFVKTLKTSNLHGTPGKELLQFAGSVSSDDLLLISQAIETEFEQVDPNEW